MSGSDPFGTLRRVNVGAVRPLQFVQRRGPLDNPRTRRHVRSERRPGRSSRSWPASTPTGSPRRETEPASCVGSPRPALSAPNCRGTPASASAIGSHLPTYSIRWAGRKTNSAQSQAGGPSTGKSLRIDGQRRASSGRIGMAATRGRKPALDVRENNLLVS